MFHLNIEMKVLVMLNDLVICNVRYQCIPDIDPEHHISLYKPFNSLSASSTLDTPATTEPPAPPGTATTDTKSAKPKRTCLKVSDCTRIIDQFKHGIPNPYYSVKPNPKKPGEYIANVHLVASESSAIRYSMRPDWMLVKSVCLSGVKSHAFSGRIT